MRDETFIYDYKYFPMSTMNKYEQEDVHSLSTILGKKFEKIAVLSDAEVKIRFLSERTAAIVQLVTQVEMPSDGMYKILKSSDWKEKLEYFMLEDSITALQVLGFNGSHLSQIVVNAGWKEKLSWLFHKDFYQIFLSGFEQTHIAKILKTKEWKERIGYVMKYKERVSLLIKEQGKNEIMLRFLKKDWKKDPAFTR